MAAGRRPVRRCDDKADGIRLGDHTLRVRTDDDEVDLAYYFFDDHAAASSPDRLAFLLYDSWPLPTGAAAAGATFDHDVLALPQLTARLRDAGELPHDGRLLRALIAPGDDDPGPALRRYARLPGYQPDPADLRPERPTGSLIELDTHIVQVARFVDDFFGFDQWFLFDSRWAAAHPDLARSLLRCAAHWDPYDRG